MPSSCCVSNCLSRVGNYDPKVSYHRFPTKDAILLQKWVVAVNREKGWIPSKWSSVCSKHFTDDSFKESINVRKRCLKIDAFPTIFEHNFSGNKQYPNENEQRNHNVQFDSEHKSNKIGVASEPILLFEQCGNVDSDTEIEITEFSNRSSVQKTIEIDSDDEERSSVLIDHNYAEIKPTYINNFCRICAKYYEHNNILEYIFSNSNQILENLSHCLPVLILETDSLPHWICRKCILKLESVIKFIEMSQNSELKLRDIFLNKLFNISNEISFHKNIKEETIIKEEMLHVEPTEERNQPKKNIIIHDVISIFPNVTKTELVDFTECDTKPDVNNILLNVRGPITCDVQNCGLVFTDMNEFDAHIENNHLAMHSITKANIVLKQEIIPDRRSIIIKNISDLNNTNNKKSVIFQETNHNSENILASQLNEAQNLNSCVLKQEQLVDRKSVLESSSSDVINSLANENCNNDIVQEITHESNILTSSRQLNNHTLKLEITPEKNYNLRTSSDACIIENELNTKTNTCQNSDSNLNLINGLIPPINNQTDSSILVDNISTNNIIEEGDLRNNGYSANALFTCHICDKQFEDKFKLDEHCLIHTLRHKICINCRHTCKSLYDYALHKQKCYNNKNTNKTNIICDMCNQKFISKLALNHHKRFLCMLSKGLSFKCNICRASFKYQYTLRAHMRQHRFNNFKLKSKASRANNNILKENVTNERKLNKKSKTDQIFLVAPHISPSVTSTELNHKYFCTICPRRYTKLSSLKRHKLQHKPYSEWQYECLKCSKRFEKIKDLKDHSIKCLMDEKVDQEKKFEDINSSNKRAWVCRICSKRLTTKMALTNHERIHTGSKPYICDVCGQQFRTVHTLIQHKFIHTTTSFPCQLCNKNFTRKSNLQVHVKSVHIKMKSYKCLICFKGFTQNVSLKNHYIRIHKTTKYIKS